MKNCEALWPTNRLLHGFCLDSIIILSIEYLRVIKFQTFACSKKIYNIPWPFKFILRTVLCITWIYKRHLLFYRLTQPQHRHNEEYLILKVFCVIWVPSFKYIWSNDKTKIIKLLIVKKAPELKVDSSLMRDAYERRAIYIMNSFIRLWV